VEEFFGREEWIVSVCVCVCVGVSVMEANVCICVCVLCMKVCVNTGYSIHIFSLDLASLSHTVCVHIHRNINEYMYIRGLLNISFASGGE